MRCFWLSRAAYLSCGSGGSILDKDGACSYSGCHVCAFTSAPLHRDAKLDSVERQASFLGTSPIFFRFSDAILNEVAPWT